MNATSSRYQATIEADPNLPIVRITRDFDATPAQLMRAHILGAGRSLCAFLQEQRGLAMPSSTPSVQE